MHLDVQDLRSFYGRTGLGRLAQHAIRDQLSSFWPEDAGLTVVGFGFATPVLGPSLASARRVIALMPGPQGVMPWPPEGPNVAVLCEEIQWPLETGSVDRLVVMHGLETSDRPTELLSECWRVLGPGGRAVFVVPNRAGLWSRRERTPFGSGRPYSLGQLEAQIRQTGFIAERHAAVLYTPPSRRRFWLRAAPAIERVACHLPSVLAGGVLLVEATKQVYRRRPTGLKEIVRRPLRVLEGLPQPGVKPV